MMRGAAILIGLVAALTACNSHGDGWRGFQQRACLTEFRFNSDQGRSDFVAANIPALVAAATVHSVFATADEASGDTVEFVSAPSQCSVSAVRRLFVFAEPSVISASATPLAVANANSRLSTAVTKGRDENHSWRCVVRTRHEGFMLRLVTVMDFVGLRTPQVEDANGNLFLAADDSCDLVAGVLVHAFRRVEGRTLAARDYTVCPTSSLRQCGWPSEVGIVRRSVR